MTDQQRIQTYVPALSSQADPESIIAMMPRAERPRITQATNQASPVPVVLVAAGMIVTGSVLIFWLFWRLAGWPLVAAAIPALGAFFGSGWYALIVLNGDLPAITEVKESERTERKRLDVAAQVAADHYETLRYQAAAWRDVEVERTAGDAWRHQMQVQLTGVVDAVNRLSSQQAQPQLPGPSTFVPATTRPALEAVREWLLSIYDQDTGTWRPDLVLESGQLRQRTPFGATGAWKSEPWGSEARQLLAQAQHGQSPIIVSMTDANGTHRGWRVSAEYAQRDAATRWLAKF